MTQNDLPQRPSPRETPRWQYRMNVVVLALVAVGIIGFLDFFSTKSTRTLDLSVGRVHSLSDQSKNLLETINQGDKDFDLINEGQEDDEKSQQVDDLLDSYAAQTSRVKVVHVRTAEELSQLVKDRYKAELKPYEDVREKYDALLKDLSARFKTEGSALEQAGSAAGLSANERKGFQQLETDFSDVLPQNLDDKMTEIQDAVDQTTPDWSTATHDMTDFIDQLVPQLKDLAQGDSKGTPGAQAYYKDAVPRLNAMVAEMENFKKTVEALPPLKSQEVMRSIGHAGVLVLGPDSVKVIPASDIYQYPPDETQDPSKAQPLFEGEQAVSSALLAMTNPVRPKVVFVSLNGSGLTTGEGDYAAVTDLLAKQNFEVLEWAAQPPAPSQDNPSPPPASDPPAQGAGVTWIVLPPPPPNQQMMMMGMPPPDPSPLVNAVKKHLDAGGNALFLAGAASPQMAMMGLPSSYPFSDMLKNYGIDVKSNYWVVQLQQANENEDPKAAPQLSIESYPAHPITKTMGALRLILAPQFTRAETPSVPTVVEPAAKAPSGITTAVFLTTPTSSDYWGEVNPGENMTFDNGKDADGKPITDPAARDIPAPVDMGVTAEKALPGNAGDKTHFQRIAAVGNSTWPSNLPVRMRVMGIAFYPGNGQLFTNTVAWLGGYDNMIALGPKVSAARRIVAIGDTELILIKTALMTVLPLLALVAGVAVFVVRRR